MLIQNLKQPCWEFVWECSCYVHIQKKTIRNAWGYSVKKLRNLIRSEISLKVPQTGWNNIYDLKSALFTGIAKTVFVILSMDIMPASEKPRLRKPIIFNHTVLPCIKIIFMECSFIRRKVRRWENEF